MSSTSLTSSLNEPDNPLKLRWDVRKLDTFEVEMADEGDDIVYHFWPPDGEKEFPDYFATLLQQSFMGAFERQPKDEDGSPRSMSRPTTPPTPTRS